MAVAVQGCSFILGKLNVNVFCSITNVNDSTRSYKISINCICNETSYVHNRINSCVY